MSKDFYQVSWSHAAMFQLGIKDDTLYLYSKFRTKHSYHDYILQPEKMEIKKESRKHDGKNKRKMGGG